MSDTQMGLHPTFGTRPHSVTTFYLELNSLFLLELEIECNRTIPSPTLCACVHCGEIGVRLELPKMRWRRRAGFGAMRIAIAPEYTVHFPAILDRLKPMLILVNLVGNARDAAIAGDQPDKQLKVRAEVHHGDRLRIIVADNGAGTVLKLPLQSQRRKAAGS